MSVIIIDGIRIDDETGEILEGVTSDKAQYAAFQLNQAKEQIKAWEQVAATWSAAVLRHQPTKTETYEADVETAISATIVQPTNNVVNMDELREWLWETEITADDLKALLRAVSPGNWRSPFKLDLLPEHLREVVEDMTNERTGEPYVLINKKRKIAPQVTREEVDLVPALEASVAAIKGEKA